MQNITMQATFGGARTRAPEGSLIVGVGAKVIMKRIGVQFT